MTREPTSASYAKPSRPSTSAASSCPSPTRSSGPIAASRRRLLELCRSPPERLFVVPARLDPVHEQTFLRVLELLAGKLARVRLERAHLRGKPRIVLELGGQCRRVLGQRGRGTQHLRLDAARELSRPVVRVDEVVRMPPEPQPHLEAALDR